jgi:hypothetical protein
MRDRRRFDALVLMGPAGSGKSHLGAVLHERGIARFRELEPLLREKFGSGPAFGARIREAGAFVWDSYQEQLRQTGPAPVFGSAGIDDRPLLERLQRNHSIGFVHVDTPPELCVERVVSRPPEGNINHTTDRERMRRYMDLWRAKIFPMYDYALTVSGDDVESACRAIRELLGGGP